RATHFAGGPCVGPSFPPGCGFPQAHRPIWARRAEKSAIPAEGHRKHITAVPPQGAPVAMAEALKVLPLESLHIAIVFREVLIVQQLENPSRMPLIPGAAGQAHLRYVKIEPGPIALFLSQGPGGGLLILRCAFAFPSACQQHETGCQPKGYNYEHGCCGSHSTAVFS